MKSLKVVLLAAREEQLWKATSDSAICGQSRDCRSQTTYNRSICKTMNAFFFRNVRFSCCIIRIWSMRSSKAVFRPKAFNCLKKSTRGCIYGCVLLQVEVGSPVWATDPWAWRHVGCKTLNRGLIFRGWEVITAELCFSTKILRQTE